MVTVLKSFDKWKQFLGERINMAEHAGMSEETIAKLAYQIGEFLASQIDPENNEERILKDLWDAGNDEEQKVLARLMVRMVAKEA